MPTSVSPARLVLKKKDAPNPVNPIELSLYRKLELNLFDPHGLSVIDQNALCSIIDHHMHLTFSIKELLQPLGLGTDYYMQGKKPDFLIKKLNNTLRIYSALTEKKINIDFNLAERVCTLWNNSIVDKHFSKVRIKEKNKMYINTAAAITYTLNFRTFTEEKLNHVIEIIMDSALRMKTFTYIKGNLYDILVGKILFDKKFDSIFEVQNAIQFRLKYYYRGSKHETTFNGRFKKLFINTFFNHNPERGNEIFERNKYVMSKWFDSISAEFDTAKPLRDTCGLKFVSPNENMNSLLQEYFLYLTMQKSNVLPTDLIKEGWWSSFVDHVRYSYGYSNFWKIIIKSQVDKRK